MAPILTAAHSPRTGDIPGLRVRVTPGWGSAGRRGARLESLPVAHRSRAQLARRRRIETLIGVAAPLLDVVLYAGERVSRVAGRGDIDPEPPRRIGSGTRTAPDRLRRTL
jgi:hypothetical protein